MYTPTSLSDNVINLTSNEKAKLFQLITENAELFNKIMPNLPLVQQIIAGTVSTIAHPIAADYANWKNNN